MLCFQGLNSVFSLRLSDDLGAFIVEPATATGSASVTLRLNSTLDYEDPNQRKFILEVSLMLSHLSYIICHTQITNLNHI